MSNAVVNEQYRRQLRLAQETKADGDWLKYILAHERPYQMDVFRKVAEELTDVEYWSLLGEIYIMSENNHRYMSTLKKALNSNRACREMIMTGRERAYFRKLPSQITIHRGYAHKNAAGWSWTLDKAKAVWFARRYAEVDDLAGKPRLATGTVKKKGVIAYFSRRKEKEILVDPKKVKIESRELV